MPFRRGASLHTADTLGFTDLADLGPTAGNGFRTRWPDDLALLQDIGIEDITLTLDWARLQPKPGTIDEDWAERFDQIMHAADAIGLEVLACLHDGSIPKWFDNEGGFSDDEAFARWWPRWVERAAERFGDTVSAWAPFALIPGEISTGTWNDTWGILDGGPPVVASLDLPGRRTAVESYVGRMDQLGIVLGTDWEPDDEVTSVDIAEAADRWGTEIRDASDQIDKKPVRVLGFAAGHTDPSTVAAIVEALVATLASADEDGVDIVTCFLAPGIAGADSLPGLLDHDRKPTAGAEVFLSETDA